VPMDGEYPGERLAFMLEDAQVRVLLTQADVAEHLPSHQVQEVWLEEDWERISKQPVRALAQQVEGDNLAYVIYTSGSTGKAKGVEATNAGVVNRALAQEEMDPFREQDICCQKTAIGFVDSIFEILGPLMSGRPLVVVPEDVGKDGEWLVELLESAGVTRLVTVPLLARAVTQVAQVSRRLGGCAVGL